MNFKKISRSLVCLLLVACMLVSISPVRANATGLVETVGAFLVSNPLALLGTVIAGLGVVAVADHYDVFENVVRECETWMRANTDFFTEDGVYVAERTYGQHKYYAISESFIQAVRDFLFESATVTESINSTAGMLQGVGFSIAAGSDKFTWASSLPLSNMVGSADNGTFLLIAVDASSLQGATRFYGFTKAHSSLYGAEAIRASYIGNLKPYTSSSWPCGYFVDGYTANFNESIWMNELVFLDYESALTAYQAVLDGATQSGAVIKYLTESSYIRLFENSSTVNFYNLGFINVNTGAEYEGTYSAIFSSVYYPIVPSGYFSEDITVVGTTLDVGISNVATSDKILSEGYADWATGVITLPGSTTIPNQDEEDKYYPIDFPPDISDVFDMTQEEAQGGTKTETDSNVGTNSDPVTGTNLKSWIQSLKDSLAQWFSRLTLHVSNIFDAVKTGFADLLSALASLPTLVLGFFRTLASHFKGVFLLGELLKVLGEYLKALFGWLPENMFAVLMLLFGVSIFYKFIGR